MNFFSLVFLAQFEMNQLQERASYDHLGGATRTEGHQQIMPLPGLNFHVTSKIATDHNKTFVTPDRIKFLKNIMIGNVCGFSQVHENLFPFKSTIVQQRVLNLSVHLLHMPLKGVEDQFIPLAPNNPQNQM